MNSPLDYTMDGSATITDSDFDEAYWCSNTSNPTGDPNVETYLAFDDPSLGTWSSAVGAFYFAGVISEFESAAELTVLAEPTAIPTTAQESTVKQAMASSCGLQAKPHSCGPFGHR